MITLTKVYTDYDKARRAVRELEARGIPSADISLVANQHVSELHDDVTETSGAGTGAGVGAMVGGAAGLLTGLGLLAIPGLGPVVAAGWLATTALGAVAGGATGGLLGALVGAGVPEEHAHVYSEAVRRGGTLLSVKTADADEATALVSHAYRTAFSCKRSRIVLHLDHSRGYADPELIKKSNEVTKSPTRVFGDDSFNWQSA